MSRDKFHKTFVSVFTLNSVLEFRDVRLTPSNRSTSFIIPGHFAPLYTSRLAILGLSVKNRL